MPLRLLLAEQRGAAWALCMGLIAIFLTTPGPPPTADIAFHGLAALVDGDALHIDLLLGLAAIALQRFELSGKGAGETVQGAFSLQIAPRWCSTFRAAPQQS